MALKPSQFDNRYRQIDGMCREMDKEQLIEVARRLGVVDFILESEDYLNQREREHLSEVEQKKQNVLDALYKAMVDDGNAVAGEKYLNYYKDMGGAETDEHVQINITPFVIQDSIRYAPAETK